MHFNVYQLFFKKNYSFFHYERNPPILFNSSLNKKLFCINFQWYLKKKIAKFKQAFFFFFRAFKIFSLKQIIRGNYWVCKTSQFKLAMNVTFFIWINEIWKIIYKLDWIRLFEKDVNKPSNYEKDTLYILLNHLLISLIEKPVLEINSWFYQNEKTEEIK